jgi:signal transduction histidine kinase
LSIVREIARQHHAEIQVETAHAVGPLQGTRISLRFQLKDRPVT